MFWDSVITGLKMLTYWETYVAGLEYLALFFIPMAIVGLAMDKNEGGGGLMGCLSMLILPVLQVVAMAVFILTLAPLIFGLSEDASWGFPWNIIAMVPSAFLKLIGVLVISAIVLAFIPIIGQLNSLQTLVLGGITLVFVIGIMDSINPNIAKIHIKFFPGFWFSFGLLIIGGIMSWIGIMVAALIATGLEIAGEGIGGLIMFPISAIFGFIPVFMYGAWLGAQLKSVF